MTTESRSPLGEIKFTEHVYTQAEVDALLAKKQDTLHPDSIPTEGSENVVTSGGVKAYVDGFASAAIEALDEIVEDLDPPSNN